MNYPRRRPASGRSTDFLLKPELRVDGVRALRALLKLALQRLGLRCVSIEEVGSERARHDSRRATT